MREDRRTDLDKPISHLLGVSQAKKSLVLCVGPSPESGVITINRVADWGDNKKRGDVISVPGKMGKVVVPEPIPTLGVSCNNTKRISRSEIGFVTSAAVRRQGD